MTSGTLKPHFLDTGEGRIFALAHIPVRQCGPAVLIVPPFGEEMNKSRRMMTELSTLLVDRGRPVISVDLFGTGDSEGEFADATWTRWRIDVRNVAVWAAANGWAVGAMVGIRLGCALAIESASTLDPTPGHAIFWQPVVSGSRYLDQFLRLGVAAAIARGRANVSVSEYRKRLASGQTLEIAGYPITPILAAELDLIGHDSASTMPFKTLDWLEVGRGDSSNLPVASQSAVTALEKSGATIRTCVVNGAPFWGSTEIVVIPELITLTAARLANDA